MKKVITEQSKSVVFPFEHPPPLFRTISSYDFDIKWGDVMDSHLTGAIWAQSQRKEEYWRSDQSSQTSKNFLSSGTLDCIAVMVEMHPEKAKSGPVSPVPESEGYVVVTPIVHDSGSSSAPSHFHHGSIWICPRDLHAAITHEQIPGPLLQVAWLNPPQVSYSSSTQQHHNNASNGQHSSLSPPQSTHVRHTVRTRWTRVLVISLAQEVQFWRITVKDLSPDLLNRVVNDDDDIAAEFLLEELPQLEACCIHRWNPFNEKDIPASLFSFYQHMAPVVVEWYPNNNIDNQNGGGVVGLALGLSAKQGLYLYRVEWKILLEHMASSFPPLVCIKHVQKSDNEEVGEVEMPPMMIMSSVVALRRSGITGDAGLLFVASCGPFLSLISPFIPLSSITTPNGSTSSIYMTHWMAHGRVSSLKVIKGSFLPTHLRPLNPSPTISTHPTSHGITWVDPSVELVSEAVVSASEEGTIKVWTFSLAPGTNQLAVGSQHYGIVSLKWETLTTGPVAGITLSPNGVYLLTLWIREARTTTGQLLLTRFQFVSLLASLRSYMGLLPYHYVPKTEDQALALPQVVSAGSHQQSFTSFPQYLAYIGDYGTGNPDHQHWDIAMAFKTFHSSVMERSIHILKQLEESMSPDFSTKALTSSSQFPSLPSPFILQSLRLKNIILSNWIHHDPAMKDEVWKKDDEWKVREEWRIGHLLVTRQSLLEDFWIKSAASFITSQQQQRQLITDTVQPPKGKTTGSKKNSTSNKGPAASHPATSSTLMAKPTRMTSIDRLILIHMALGLKEIGSKVSLVWASLIKSWIPSNPPADQMMVDADGGYLPVGEEMSWDEMEQEKREASEKVSCEVCEKGIPLLSPSTTPHLDALLSLHDPDGISTHQGVHSAPEAAVPSSTTPNLLDSSFLNGTLINYHSPSCIPDTTLSRYCIVSGLLIEGWEDGLNCEGCQVVMKRNVPNWFQPSRCPFC